MYFSERVSEENRSLKKSKTNRDERRYNSPAKDLKNIQ